LFAFSYT